MSPQQGSPRTPARVHDGVVTMRARARSMLVVGLLGGGLLVALPAAGATESPPDCEGVRVLAQSFQPSAAVALAEQIDAGARSASPVPVASAAPVGTPDVSATTPAAQSLCAEELGDAQERAAAAVVARDVAQSQDKEATEIEPQDAAAAADLRRQADALYALALTTDAGLADARAEIAPDGAEAASSARLVAARQLKDLGKPAEARLLASDLVRAGAAKAEDVDAAGLAPSSAPPVQITDWWTTTVSPWLRVGAWVAAGAVVIGLLAALPFRRPDYELRPAAVTSAGTDLAGAAADWSTAVPQALRRLAAGTPMARVLTAPDVVLALPAIDGIPAGFKAVVEFWTWFRRINGRVVTTNLEVVNGTPTAVVRITTRRDRPRATTTLRTVRTSPAPLDAAQVAQAFLDLASEAATWVAFRSTPSEERESVFGSTVSAAVVHVAGAAASMRRGDRASARAALGVARIDDPTMLEARLNLAVLDTTEPGAALNTLSDEAVARGREALAAVSADAEALGLAPMVDGQVTRVLRRNRVRLQAIALRARFNEVIVNLNVGAKPPGGAERLLRADELSTVRNRAELLVAEAGGASGLRRAVETAKVIGRHAWLMYYGHVAGWAGGYEACLARILDVWAEEIRTTDPPWEPEIPQTLVPLPEVPGLEEDVPPVSDLPGAIFPASTSYSIACIAAERGTAEDAQPWLDRAFAVDAPHYVVSARKDPYFAGL